jgi:hypothetical protein
MSSARSWLRYVTVLAVGVLLAPLKLVYSFLPAFNVLDLVVFGGLAAFLTHRSAGEWWVVPLLLATPSLVLVAWILQNLSWGELRAGVGTGWLISFILIPGAAFGGVYLRRRSLRTAASGSHAT